MIMDSLFTIANFLVFAGFITYLSKTKLIPMVKAMITAHKKAQQDLVDQTISASALYRALQEKLASQDALYANLDKKVEQWQKTLDLKKAAFAKAREQQASFMQTYGAKQEAFLNASHKAKMVLPLVMQETEATLLKHFAQKDTRQAYDQKAIKHLARRAS
jgi:hypothetical protein